MTTQIIFEQYQNYFICSQTLSEIIYRPTKSILIKYFLSFFFFGKYDKIKKYSSTKEKAQILRDLGLILKHN